MRSITLLVLVGAALGPHGINLLSIEALSFVDPAMPVALVALGMLLGLEVSTKPRGQGRLFAAAVTEGGITAAAVAVGILLMAPVWAAPTTVPPWLFALVLGVCAAPSAAASLRPGAEPPQLAERVGDLDALLPIAAGGVALALVRAPAPVEAFLVALQACGVALVITLAAWLLLSTSSSERDQRVFTVALLLLLGGAADYLSLSALLSGLIAGLFLALAGGLARDSVRRDVLHFQHPLLALVLVVTGARVDIPLPWLGVGLVYLLLRTAAKLAGGWAARRIAGATVPPNLGMSLLSPGILGVAFALNVLRAAGPEAAGLLTVATLGAIGSDVLAVLVRPREESA